MAVRRSITFYHLFMGEAASPYGLHAESVALLISLLMVIGLALISPLFDSIKRSREKIEKANRTLRTRSECNQALVRATGEKQLLNEICRIIVDDNEVNRQLLHEMTLSLGHKPVLAENGLSALAQMRKKLPDLVLLDILMPEMDGYAVLDRMKSDNSMRYLPVIMISAVDQMESIIRCIKKGADDYIVKPYDATLLRARIEASLEKK